MASATPDEIADSLEAWRKQIEAERREHAKTCRRAHMAVSVGGGAMARM